MIITQTPFRISFFGGGTDYPDYFEKNGSGAVIGTAIDHSAYLSVSHFYSKLFDYSIRIAYRKVECVKTLEEIEHGPFRECLRHCGLSTDVEINYTGELPSFSGLGSSSSFTVGLLNALHAFQGKMRRPIDLAIEAIGDEVRRLRTGGVTQDELSHAQDFLTGSLALRLETNDGVAGTLTDMELYGLGMDYIVRYADIFRGVTRQQILQVAEKYSKLEDAVIVTAGPKKD